MCRHGLKLFFMVSATRFNQERVFNLTSTLQLADIAVYTGMRVQLQAMDSTVKMLAEICRRETSIYAGKLTGGQFEQHARPGWPSCCDGEKYLL